MAFDYVADEHTEVWKDIVGYENYYQVSNLGRVKSVPRKIWNGKGYSKKEVV